MAVPMAPGAVQPPRLMRLAVVLSVVLYAVCGIPVWWATTKLQRPELPHAAMQAVASEVSPDTAMLPITFTAYVLLADEGAKTEVSDGLLNAMARTLEQHKPALLQGKLQLISAMEGSDGKCSSSSSSRRSSGDPACLGLASWSDANGLDRQNELAALDVRLHKALAAAPQGAQPGHYTLFVLPNTWPPVAAAERGSSLVVGQHRHAWVTYDPGQTLSSSALQEVTAAAAALVLKRCFALEGSAESVTAAEGLPLSAAAHAVLSFTLLNADPAGGVVAWGDFESFERRYLRPVLNALGSVAHLTVESQMLYYTPARANGTWSDTHQAYTLPQQQLPFFIDSDWNLESGRAVVASDAADCKAGTGCSCSSGDTGSGGGSIAAIAAQHAELLESHVLHFLLYVPAPGQRPLRLLDRAGKPLDSNSFWLPAWGGVIIINPHESAGTHARSGSSQRNSGSGEGRDASSSSSVDESTAQYIDADSHEEFVWQRVMPLDDATHKHVAGIVVSQLHALLGLPLSNIPTNSSSSSSSSSSQLRFLPAPATGFALWEVEALLRQRSAADLVSAAGTLASLSRLVQELPNLEMPDLIGQQVHQSLAAIQRTLAAVTAGDYHAASVAAQAARASAEAAFLHPAVLTQLNFPESHKLGIYMPFFLPVCVPVLQGLASELLRYVKQRRRWAATQRLG